MLVDAEWNVEGRLTDGVMARALPIEEPELIAHVAIDSDPYEITQTWPASKVSPFMETGCCCGFEAATCRITETYEVNVATLGDVIVPAADVPDEFWVPKAQLPKWGYLKGSKREKRVSASGHEYWYSEGSMAYPDLLTNPSRTILTGEGGNGASRFKHIIEQDGRMRRLVPDELDVLQGFPQGWTDTGMRDTQRAFCMGNALVVGVVHRIGEAIVDLAV